VIAGGLEIQLFAGLARLHKDMQDAKRMVSQTMGEVGALAQRASTALGAIGVGVSVAGLLTLTKRTIDAVDALNDLNKSTAIGVRDLAGLGYAAQVSGSNIAGAAAAINKLSQNIGKDAEKYRALGITAKEPIEAFKQLADLFNSIEDPQLRAALGAEALGKGWSAAAPLLAEGGKRIGELVERGATLSGVTEEMARQADEFNDKLAELAGTGAVMNRVIGPMLPLLIGAVNGLLEARDAAVGAQAGFNPFVETLRVLIVVGGNVAYVLKTVAIEAGGIAAQVAAMLSGDFERVASIGSMMNVDAIKARQAFDEWERGILNIGSAAASAEPKVRGLSEAERKAAEARARAFVSQEEMAKLAKEELRRRYEAAKAELDAEEMFARDYAEAWKWADHYRTEEEKKESKLRQEIAQAEMDAREMALDDFIGAWKAYDEYVRKLDRQRAIDLEQQTREFTRAGEIMASGFTQMFSDLLDGRLRDWKDFAKQLANTFKTVVVDFVGSAIRGLMNNLMTQLANGSFSLGGVMGGVNPLALAFAGGSIGANLITGALGSGARGQQIGTYAGGAGAALGFALGGPIGAVAGAVIGGLIGHFSDPDGLAQRSATFGSTTGARGLTGYTYTSPFGTFGLSDTSWFSDQDMGEQLRRYFGGMAAWERSISGFLSEEETARVTAALSGPGARYGFGEEHGDFSGTLGEMTADRARTILNAVDPVLAQLVEGFQGTGEELGQFVLSLLGMRQALADMNVTGLNMETLQLMGRAGETLEQTFQRVAGTWSWFTQNFYTEAEQLEMATTQVNGVFAQLGLEVPGSVTEFRRLVEGLDLSTEEGRRLWDMLMDVAPAFLTVTNAADDATTATEDLADALERQAEIQRQIEESVRESRESQLAAIVGARGGLANFLNGTALGGLSPMTPQEKLAEAKRQYEAILAAAMGGDLGAAGRLGGAAETYLQIAREMFASGSGYISIYDQVMGQVKGVDQRLAIDEQILRATLGMATDIAAQTEILIEVKSLLIDIRDKGPAVVAGDTKPR
jgi:hypothetical protein